MKNTHHPHQSHDEHWEIAGLLSKQYGDLALSRAAGNAAKAERQGNEADSIVWHDVVSLLRQAMTHKPQGGKPLHP